MHIKSEDFIPFVGGAVGGTVGAIVTCPLDVVRTRLQSSQPGFDVQASVITSTEANNKTTCKTVPPCRRRLTTVANNPYSVQMVSVSSYENYAKSPKTMGPIASLRYIIKHEGVRALFRGLGANIVGVAPSRAIYFCSYTHSKDFFNGFLRPDTSLVHILSSACSGFVSSTLTNPVWLVKTRLQLDRQGKLGSKLTTTQCIRRIYKKSGIRGFYKGVTASYFGISETILFFLLYEQVKASMGFDLKVDPKTMKDILEIMVVSASLKTVACFFTYPHEVVRTRLREEDSRYKSFCRTLVTVFREEGNRGLYRGFLTHIMRQIPNNAITMGTYEGIVSYLEYWNDFDIT